MHKVLILGAGLVARPMVRYLTNQNIFITIASRTLSKAKHLTENKENALAVEWTVDRVGELEELVRSHEVVVSLLPYQYHQIVAECCLRNKVHLVTTSYLQDAMKALNEQAKDAGISMINELGLDPGIDHMSACRIIQKVHNEGGQIDEFYSVCGALPAPEVIDNPFGYKFSWSPLGVIKAGKNNATYLKAGNVVEVPSEMLFKDIFDVDFNGVGKLQVYPNRDSRKYAEVYEIPETKTLLRGTFRFPGWCESIDVMKALNLFSEDELDEVPNTYFELLLHLAGERNLDALKEKIVQLSQGNTDTVALKAFEWLGLFSDEEIMGDDKTPFNIFGKLMIRKMSLEENERDMIVLMHVFYAIRANGEKEIITSKMVDYGTPITDTAIARTVTLPAAIAVRLLLEGGITRTGVYRPVFPDVYNPVMDELETLGIKMIEEFGLPLSARPW